MIDFSNFPNIATPKTLSDIPLETPEDQQQMSDLVSGTHGFPGSGMNGIILHGKFGAGKSTAAMLIPDAMEQTNIGMNCPWRTMHRILGNNNGVGLLTQINSSCYVMNLNGKYVYVILDEVDNLTPPAMQQLKSVMDNHVDRVVFIMTTNHLQKIDPAVRNRSYSFGFNKVPASAWLPSMQRVLATYGITSITDEQLISAASSINGSGRKFASCLKHLITGYYQMYPHLVPPHLLLPNSSVTPIAIAIAQPLPVLPAIPLVQQTQTVLATTSPSPSQPTP